MRHRPLRRAACALLLAGLAGPLAAQDIGRVVAFGDSYADNGNLKRILGAFFPSTEYPTGRFSGGTNFVDTLSTFYGVEQVNYAVGGARAGSSNVVLPSLPGFEQQWTSFVAAGQSFAPTDLGVFSVGGNDARAYRVSGSLAGADAAAAATAAQAATGLDALVARGLRRMVFIVGDTGQLPEALGKPSAATGTAFSNAYNADIQPTLARYARGGVTVAYVDITRIGTIVRADPARFGFRDVTTACPQACIGDPALQRQYFFYVDQVHLTSAAFDLVGRYAINQLAAPYTFRANGDVAQRAAEEFGRTLGGRLDLARARDARGFSTWGSFIAGHDHRDADAGTDGYRYDGRGGSLGAESAGDHATLGAAIAWSRGHADQPGGRTRADTYLIGGYAGTHVGALYAQAYSGYGWDNLSIRRDGVADPLRAKTDGESWYAGGRAGYLQPLGALRIGPTIATDYARTKIDGYTETGDYAAALGVGGQTIRQLLGSAGLEGRYAVTPGIVPWARVEAEKRLVGDGRRVEYEPEAATDIVNTFEITSASKHVFGSATGGVSARLGRAISLEVQARATFARRDGDEASGQAGVRLAF